MIIKAGTLKKASRLNPGGLMRLAKYLRLCITGMSTRQIAKLVSWRLNRHKARY